MNRFFLITITLLCSSSVWAETILPIAAPISRYSAIWENSPFSREVVKASSAPIFNSFGKNFVLDGIVDDDVIGVIAYVRNLADNQSLVVTRLKSDDHPFTIVDANIVNDHREARVKITNGKDVSEIGFQENLVNQKIHQEQPKTAAAGANAAAKGNPPATPNAAPQNGANKNSSNTTSNSQESAAPPRASPRILLPPRPKN